jgi:SAM-dependent methyltransferase
MRRFIFTDRFLVRFGRFVPYYRVNTNQADAEGVADMYGRLLTKAARTLPRAAVLLEIGSGATNAVGYALARSAWAPEARIILQEPFAPLDQAADQRDRAGASESALGRVRRITSLADIAPGSVDLVVSHSVLEHVRDLPTLFGELERVLAPGGAMLHVVDYRDHFFKYPYHFLTFSRPTWERWLDPGDLPRWRIGQHIALLDAMGFCTEVLESSTLEHEYNAVRGGLHPDFDPGDASVAVARAALLSRRC